MMLKFIGLLLIFVLFCGTACKQNKPIPKTYADIIIEENKALERFAFTIQNYYEERGRFPNIDQDQIAMTKAEQNAHFLAMDEEKIFAVWSFGPNQSSNIDSHKLTIEIRKNLDIFQGSLSLATLRLRDKNSYLENMSRIIEIEKMHDQDDMLIIVNSDNGKFIFSTFNTIGIDTKR